MDGHGPRPAQGAGTGLAPLILPQQIDEDEGGAPYGAVHQRDGGLLESIMPLHLEPDTPVFTNVEGEPIEPKVFSTHWYDCLRVLGIRTRGLYCTKDTFCSLAVTRGVNPSWLEQQTGVVWRRSRSTTRSTFPIRVGTSSR